MVHGQPISLIISHITNTTIMHYTYVLKSQKDNKFYIGSTANIENRFLQHQNGDVPSTKGRRPLDLVFYEAFPGADKARQRERYFKTTKGKVALDRMLN